MNQLGTQVLELWAGFLDEQASRMVTACLEQRFDHSEQTNSYAE
jgi:hypothetical protein